jgi:hypothetical protein
MVAAASQAQYCFICGGTHDIEECPLQDNEQMKDAFTRMRLIMEEQSKSPRLELPLPLARHCAIELFKKRSPPYIQTGGSSSW